MDFANLQGSHFTQGRNIIADRGVEALFTNYCLNAVTPDLYPNLEAARARIMHFSMEEIAEVVRSANEYLWLTFGTQFGNGDYQYSEIARRFDLIAIAQGLTEAPL